jgi:hypothetical protein
MNHKRILVSPEPEAGGIIQKVLVIGGSRQIMG